MYDIILAFSPGWAIYSNQGSSETENASHGVLSMLNLSFFQKQNKTKQKKASSDLPQNSNSLQYFKVYFQNNSKAAIALLTQFSV